jgi:hypothetical protein
MTETPVLASARRRAWGRCRLLAGPWMVLGPARLIVRWDAQVFALVGLGDRVAAEDRVRLCVHIVDGDVNGRGMSEPVPRLLPRSRRMSCPADRRQPAARSRAGERGSWMRVFAPVV